MIKEPHEQCQGLQTGAVTKGGAAGAAARSSKEQHEQPQR